MRAGAPCPETDGGVIPWPTMPDPVRKAWETAHKEVLGLDIVPDHHLRVDAAYLNDVSSWWPVRCSRPGSMRWCSCAVNILAVTVPPSVSGRVAENRRRDRAQTEVLVQPL
ncbi:hypothetical protein GCM10010405_05830 [Streptomyces macrosporus]|uniref:Transposase n=1 Tax=Streptomyces macrosporus TaxID=44032 RepID=A0ABN3JDV6_9ACTN